MMKYGSRSTSNLVMGQNYSRIRRTAVSPDQLQFPPFSLRPGWLKPA
jgi:hypothetical protein